MENAMVAFLKAQLVHYMDWLPTFLAAAGEPDNKNKLKKGGVQAIGGSNGRNV